jgi:hypothetical protein
MFREVLRALSFAVFPFDEVVRIAATAAINEGRTRQRLGVEIVAV